MADGAPLHAGFLAELKRRRVLRVLGFYSIGVWLAISIADIAIGALSGPDWLLMALIVAALVSFPFVAILSWIFDITPSGIVRTAPAAADPADDFVAAFVDQPRLWIDIAIIGVLLALIAFLVGRPDASDGEGLEPSIAVLPFVDLSELRNQAYFSEGIAAELLASLVRVEGVRVAGASTFNGIVDEDARAFGERLGVSTVLHGSVRRDGERVRIVAQLVDTRTGFHLWSETYDRMLDDIFAVQDDIARSIMRALRVRLADPSEVGGVRPTGDLDAYDAYLRGREALRGARLRGNVNAAIQDFEEALRIDPRFALANAGLCSAYWEMYDLEREATVVERALEACQAARARDDTLPEVHNALGWLYVGTGNFELSAEHFSRALRLSHDRNADAVRGLGVVAARREEFDAADTLLARAVEMEPTYWRNHVEYGRFLFGRGAYDAALAVVERGLERTPPNTNLYNTLGAVRLALGDREGAAAAFIESLNTSPNYPAYANAGTNYFYLGQFEAARNVYRDAVRQYPNNYELRSFLADACRQLPDGAECARENYQAAITLGLEYLAVNPSDALATARVGLIYTHLGDRVNARRYLDDALRRGSGDGNVLRSAALASALKGDLDQAIELLGRAVAAGYPVHLLRAHPDFAVLVEDARFSALEETR